MIATPTVAGLQLGTRQRAASCGTWYDATDPAGARRGALRIDAALVADAAAQQRLVAEVRAQLADRAPGCAPVADLVVQRGEIWLLLGAPAFPALPELLGPPSAAGQPSGGVAAACSVLTDTARTLIGLHAQGRAHGALDAGAVVVAASGDAVLVEAGLRGALLDAPVDPVADSRAWARLAAQLVHALCADDLRTGSQLLSTAAIAEEGDLQRALLAVQRTMHSAALTEDAARAAARDVLATRAAQAAGPAWSLAPAPTASADPFRTMVALRPLAPMTPPTRAADAESHRTLLTGAASSAHADRALRPAEDEIPADERATMLSGAGAPASGDASVTGGTLRFGPGPRQRAGAREPAGGRVDAAARGRARPRRGLLARAASALVPVAVIAGVLWYLAHAGGAALQVTAAHVSAAPATPTCGDTIDVVGTITTNGQAGDIAYTWTRNDGQPAGGTLHESVAAGQTAVTVHLAWSVEGRGRYNGVATLDVVSPSALRAVGGFTYACG